MLALALVLGTAVDGLRPADRDFAGLPRVLAREAAPRGAPAGQRTQAVAVRRGDQGEGAGGREAGTAA